MSDRQRKAKLKRLRLQVGYTLHWPEVDGVSGESGHGLRSMLTTWWRLRRGTWKDDWFLDDYDWPSDV